MRVLHVAESTAGGLGVYLEAITRAGVDRGFDVHLAVPSSPDLGTRFACRIHPWDVTARPGPQLLGEILRLRRIVAQVQPNVVHLHSSMAGLVGRLVVRGRRPTILQPHSWSFTAVSGGWSHGARRWERLAARWTHLVVCVSEGEKLAAERAEIPATMAVVRNGVDLSRFEFADDAARREARQRLGVSSSPLAVCVGRLHRQKNQAALLDAWPAVRACVQDARLALVGTGPDRDVLTARAIEGVTLVGQVVDTRDWYAAADLIVQPSRWEGMSLAVLEALASGRSVVATDVIGMTEVVESDALVPLDDIDTLAAKVAIRLADPVMAAAEGERGRHRVESDHDLSHHLQAVLDLEERAAARDVQP